MQYRSLSLFTPLLFILCVFYSDSLADETKVIRIASTSQFAPYTVDSEAKIGIDPEIITAVIERVGYQVEFVPTPSRRQASVSAREDIDAVTGWFNEFLPDCHKARPYRYWYNALIVPEGSDIQSIEDLTDKQISVFEGAERFVDGYDDISNKVKSIIIADSSLQAGLMIKMGRVDAYIGDYVAYYYALANHYDDQQAKQLTSIKHFFEPNKHNICFKDEGIRDQFDLALDELIDEQLYQKIYLRYNPNLDAKRFPTKDR